MWKWIVRCTYNNTVERPKRPGDLAIETIHKDDVSKDVEVAAAKSRGDVNVEVCPVEDGRHVCKTPSEALPGETWTCPSCRKEWWANEIVFGLDGVFISWERVR